MSDELTKIQAKILKDLHEQHKAKWQQVRKKIRRLKIKREYKTLLIADSKHCNADLMEVLFVSPQFKDLDDYLDTINAYCKSENSCYDYGSVILAYLPSKMKELMQVITTYHNRMDRLNLLIERLKE